VFRLTSGLAPHHVQKLKEHFQDILLPQGTIAASDALPGELDDVEIRHLSRLVVDFNRRDFGRLRSLIDTINDF
jgi:hypothetical protein